MLALTDLDTMARRAADLLLDENIGMRVVVILKPEEDSPAELLLGTIVRPSDLSPDTAGCVPDGESAIDFAWVRTDEYGDDTHFAFLVDPTSDCHGHLDDPRSQDSRGWVVSMEDGARALYEGVAWGAEDTPG